MIRRRELSRDDLLQARREVCDPLGVTAAELHRRGTSGSLVGDEWAAWDRLRDIEFLLGDGD